MQEIALHIMDIAENSITAEASKIAVSVVVDEQKGILAVAVKDNGRGMDAQMLDKVTSPFTTSRKTRKVGMGIPLLKAGAEAAGGSFSIHSQLGMGTEVIAHYALAHIDRPPLGSLADVFAALALANPEIDFLFEAVREKNEFICDTGEIKKTLESVSMNAPEVSEWLNEYLSEGIDEIFGGLF